MIKRHRPSAGRNGHVAGCSVRGVSYESAAVILHARTPCSSPASLDRVHNCGAFPAMRQVEGCTFCQSRTVQILPPLRGPKHLCRAKRLFAVVYTGCEGGVEHFWCKVRLRRPARSEAAVIKRNRASSLGELVSSPKSEPDGQQMNCVSSGLDFYRALHERTCWPHIGRAHSSKTITDSTFAGTVFATSLLRRPATSQPLTSLHFASGSVSQIHSRPTCHRQHRVKPSCH